MAKALISILILVSAMAARAEVLPTVDKITQAFERNKEKNRRARTATAPNSFGSVQDQQKNKKDSHRKRRVVAAKSFCRRQYPRSN